MEKSEKSWDVMSMDERLSEAGYDANLFVDYDLDDTDDYREYDDHHEDAFMDAFDEFEDYPVMDTSYIERLEAERKAWEFEIDEEAETLELLDPHCDPRMWKAHYHFIWNGDVVTVPGSGKVIVEKDPFRRRGDRAGHKPRDRNRDRRREREQWRKQLLSN